MPLSRSGPSHLLPRLREHGVDIVAAVEQGRYVSLDVGDTLSTSWGMLCLTKLDF